MLDLSLLETADLQALSSFADLRKDEGELHADGGDVNAVVHPNVGIDGDTVETHDHRRDPAIDIVDNFLERFSEQGGPQQ